MKIAVLGAGIIGISTAYELSKRGFDVTVIERNSLPAMETSFANAGLIATGHAFSWNSPKLFYELLRPNSNANSAFKINWSLSPPLLKWGLQFLRNCSKSKFIEFSNAKRNLCQYSHQILKQIILKENIACNYNSNGIYYLHRTNSGIQKAIKKINMFDGLIDQYQILNETDLTTPFFRKSKFIGGLIFSKDGAGDCHLYTTQLENICKQNGVRFQYNSEVTSINQKNGVFHSIEINNTEYKADVFILAFGPYSPNLQKELGISIPIYPVKGYSLTLPILKYNNLPKLSGIDEDNFFAFSQFGDKIRITSRAEFSGYNKDVDPKIINKLLSLTKELFGKSLDFKNYNPWIGLRPVTPKGTPFICKTKFRNLYINSGHGHLGWSMASGSAKIISDLIENKTPSINSVPYQL